MNSPKQERRFDRGAWWHLVLMLLLLVLAVGSLVYRFTLPTDGWLAYEPENFDDYGYIYQENIMDAPSDLQSGDHVIAVEGISLAEGLTPLWPLRVDWQAGSTLRYTVLRGEQELEVDVPLVKWELSRFWHGDTTARNLVGFLGIGVFLLMGFLSFWRQPDIPAARALWILSAAVFSIFIVTGFLPSMISDDVNPLATLSVIFFIFTTFTILLPPAFIRFALVFPKPKPTLQRYPWIANLPYAVGMVGIGAFLVEFYLFGWAWTATSVLIALAILVHNAITMRDAVSRAQLRWGLGGMIAGIGLFFSTFIGVLSGFSGPLIDFLDSISAFGFGVMGITLGIAVLRYHLFDIDVIIRKTLVYAILTGLLGLIYFGTVILLQGVFEVVSGQQSPIIIVISTLIIAALFSPLRRRVQRFIDRRFYRSKYDAERTLAKFAMMARDEVDLDQLTAELMGVVMETMQPESAGLWLRQLGHLQGSRKAVYKTPLSNRHSIDIYK